MFNFSPITQERFRALLFILNKIERSYLVPGIKFQQTIPLE